MTISIPVQSFSLTLTYNAAIGFANGVDDE
jgi:hypothetical protein